MTSSAVKTSNVCVDLQGGTLQVRVADETPARLFELCDFASRQNPKRGFLFVSKVLGKHTPVRPSRVLQTHRQLAALVRPHVSPNTLFLGFAETATGLGAGVFEASVFLQPASQLSFIQTTRYRFDAPVALHFQEEHSHSTGHLLYEPSEGVHLLRSETVVLIDDELSTGKTAVNFVRELQGLNPALKKVVLVSLLNWMGPARMAAVRQELAGISVEFVSLLFGEFEFTPREGYVCPSMPAVDSNDTYKDSLVPLSYGRRGESRLHQQGFCHVLGRLVLDRTRPVHVLGDGEFMHPPLLLASALERAGYDVWFQSTTRSPILEGQAIHSKTTFEDHYEDGIPNYAYNLPDRSSCSQVLLCHESQASLSLQDAYPIFTVSYEELLCA